MEKWTFFAKMLHIYFYSALRQRLLLSLSFSHFSIISPSQSLSLSHFSTFSLSIFLFLTWEHYLFASLLSLTLYIYFSHLITFSPTTLSLSLFFPPLTSHSRIFLILSKSGPMWKKGGQTSMLKRFHFQAAAMFSFSLSLFDLAFSLFVFL